MWKANKFFLVTFFFFFFFLRVSVIAISSEIYDFNVTYDYFLADEQHI